MIFHAQIVERVSQTGTAARPLSHSPRHLQHHSRHRHDLESPNSMPPHVRRISSFAYAHHTFHFDQPSNLAHFLECLSLRSNRRLRQEPPAGNSHHRHLRHPDHGGPKRIDVPSPASYLCLSLPLAQHSRSRTSRSTTQTAAPRAICISSRGIPRCSGWCADGPPACASPNAGTHSSASGQGQP